MNRHHPSILLIIPYFGSFPNYFNLWLQSCAANPSINWLIITDNQQKYNYPTNISVQLQSFDQLRKRIKSFFSFPIKLETPYDFCEFKVAYGEIFAKELSEFDFWGYCDIDLIWGNMRNFITQEILSQYNKISWRGHLTLYRNNNEINSIYRRNINGIPLYKYAFNNPTKKQYAFDERGINLLFEQENEAIYKDLPFADLKIRNKNFELLHFSKSETYKNKRQIFFWNNGSLYRLFLHNDNVFAEEFLYIHFLKRPMKTKVNPNIPFFIVPNKFIQIPESLKLKKLISKMGKNDIYWSYWTERMSISFFIKKLQYKKDLKLFNSIAPQVGQLGYPCTIPSIKNFRIIKDLKDLNK